MYVRSIPQSFIFPLFVLSFNFLMAICKLRMLFKSQSGISLASNRWNVVTSQQLKSCSSCKAKYSLAKSVPVCCVETLNFILSKSVSWSPSRKSRKRSGCSVFVGTSTVGSSTYPNSSIHDSIIFPSSMAFCLRRK